METNQSALTCQNAMASIMSDFYATSLPCISSKSILDAQNAMKSIANQDGLDRLLASNADVKALYEIPSAHDTIDAVISSGAGDGKKRASFQGGMLTECVFADYLARVLGANATYVNCDQEDISRYANVVNAVTERVPRALPRFMMQSADGRTTIVQLGGPNATDCAIVGDGRLLACCEFKDKTAKAGEFDLMEDEDGKLVADEKTLDEMMEQMPSIIPIIDDFNANDSLHNHIGHNIKLSEAEQRKIFHDYIHRGQIDAIMTFGKDDRPVLIDTHNDALDQCIQTRGGEIRTAGRNHKSVFTPKYLEQTIANSEAFHDNGNGSYSIAETVAERASLFVKKRGGTDVSRLRISNVFFVPIKDVRHDGNGLLTFRIKDVRQLKPTISAHLSCQKTQDEVRILMQSGESAQ